jgi:tetratricopeptide (TPR) repeat protein
MRTLTATDRWFPIAALLLCLSAAAPLAAASVRDDDAPAERAHELFEQGRDALFLGDTERAITLLQRAVELADDSDRSQYSLHLARAYRYAHRAEDAEELLASILAASPDHVEAGQLLAEIFAQQEKWQAILDSLEPLLEYRHDYQTHHLLAEAAYHLLDTPRALHYYQESIRLNPESAHDHYQLGNLYLASNRFALAAGSYEDALALGIESTVLHYKLGSSYFNLRNYFGRVATVSVPSGKKETISGDWFLIEEAPGTPEQFHAAPRNSAIFQVALAMEQGMKDDPAIRMMLANIYLNARRFERAHELYASLEPQVGEEDRALFYYYFAESALWLDRYEEYIGYLRKSAELDADSYGPILVDAFLDVADRYDQSGKLDRSIEYLLLALAESPATASLHLRLGDAYAEAEDLPRAVEQWRMVLDLEPDHPERTALLNRIREPGS